MRLVAATLLFTLVGCATARDIEGRDRGMFLPTGRVWVNLLPEKEGDESVRGRVFGIEASATGGQGEFDIDLLSGETISAGGGTISGPATVRTEFTMIEASVAVRAGRRLGNRFNIHGIAGLGYHETKVKLTRGATRLDRSVNGIGPLLGVHIGFEATKWLEIYGRGSILFPNFNEFNLRESQQVEVGVQFNLSDAISLIAAYRLWRFQQEDFSLGPSPRTDIDIRAGGVVVGIVIRF